MTRETHLAVGEQHARGLEVLSASVAAVGGAHQLGHRFGLQSKGRLAQTQVHVQSVQALRKVGWVGGWVGWDQRLWRKQMHLLG